MWNLWCGKWQFDRFLFEYLSLPLTVKFNQSSLLTFHSLKTDNMKCQQITASLNKISFLYVLNSTWLLITRIVLRCIRILLTFSLSVFLPILPSLWSTHSCLCPAYQWWGLQASKILQLVHWYVDTEDSMDCSSFIYKDQAALEHLTLKMNSIKSQKTRIFSKTAVRGLNLTN